MKVVFVDVDGVLRPINQRQKFDKLELCPKCSSHLLTVLNAIPDLKMVISSSWRYDMRAVKEAFRKVKLPVDRIIGNTSIEAEEDQGQRGVLIADWLRPRLNVEQYAILDDVNDFTQEQQPRLVQPDPTQGLTTFDAARLMLKFEE